MTFPSGLCQSWWSRNQEDRFRSLQIIRPGLNAALRAKPAVSSQEHFQQSQRMHLHIFHHSVAHLQVEKDNDSTHLAHPASTWEAGVSKTFQQLKNTLFAELKGGILDPSG